MRLTLFAVLLLSCAPSPRQYERGAYAPHPPAQQRPGVGLPRYDPHAKPLPPQPQPKPKRYLPPEPDGKPGIWASDEPDSGADSQWILGVPPLEPERSAEEPGYVAAMRNCANMMRLEITRAHVDDILYSLPSTPRKCAAAHLYLACVTDDLRRLEQDRAIPRDRVDSARKAASTAQGYAERQCPKGGRFQGDSAVMAASAKFRESQDLLHRKHEKTR